MYRSGNLLLLSSFIHLFLKDKDDGGWLIEHRVVVSYSKTSVNQGVPPILTVDGLAIFITFKAMERLHIYWLYSSMYSQLFTRNVHIVHTATQAHKSGSSSKEDKRCNFLENLVECKHCPPCGK